MFLSDTLTLDAPRRTQDGYLAVRARAARAGVQDYLGIEVDPKGEKFAADDVVPVYRPAEEVFNPASLHSFLMKPITNDHPKEAVTAANWKDHAGGVVAKAIRDGDHVAFDLVLMDADAIAAVDSGKRGLSNGYACDLAFEDGTAPDGTPYKAVQRGIVGNHVAIVKNGRAGPEARISDSIAFCDALPPDSLKPLNDRNGDTAVKKIMLDGLQVDLSDASAVETAIIKLQGQLKDATDAKDAAETQVATLTTDAATKDAEIVTLKKQVEDSKITPQQMRDAAKAYALTADKAKQLGVAVSDEMDEAAIMKAVVSAKVGDAAKDWNDAQVAASFGTLTAGIKDSSPELDRSAFRGGIANLGDTEASFADAQRKLSEQRRNAWKTPATAAV